MRKPARNPNTPPKRMHATGDRWYWKPERRLRPTWKSVPLGADFAPAAAEARRLNAEVDKWLAAGAQRPGPRARRRMGPVSIGSLIAEYKVSANWKLLRPRTQKQYVYEFSRLEDEFGHEPAATLPPARVDDWLDQMRLTAPETGRHVAAKGRLLYAWAQRKALIPPGVNPFQGAKLGQGNKRKVLMTPADLAIVVAACDEAGRFSLGTALVIAFAGVQRITDMWGLRQEHIAGGRLYFTQAKGEKVLARGARKPGFQVDAALPGLIAERLARRPPPATPEGWLCPHEKTLRPWDEKHAAHTFAKIRDALVASDRRHAHLAKVQMRDARRSGFVQYVMDGASVPFVCSLSGHSIEEGMDIIEHYLPKTAAQADRAVQLLSVRL